MTPAAVARYAAPVHCAINGTVVFHWAAEWHDLQRFASKQHMEDCDFDGAQALAAAGGVASTTTSYYLACATPGEEIHVANMLKAPILGGATDSLLPRRV